MATSSRGCNQRIVLNFGSLGQDDKLRRMLWVEVGGLAVVLMGEVEGLRQGFSPCL